MILQEHFVLLTILYKLQFKVQLQIFQNFGCIWAQMGTHYENGCGWAQFGAMPLID